MNRLVVLILLLCTGISGFTQRPLSEEKRKEFEAQKVAYFTSFLELTPTEAAVFWPLYNEMFKKIFDNDVKIHETIKKHLKSAQKTGSAELIDKKFAVEQENLGIKKEYYKKLLALMPAEKVLKIDRAEHTFNQQLLNKMRGDRPPREHDSKMKHP
ncbi:hypothetical protein FACS1894121_1310 [Bacteroidia bacterium]|nr:hypothetical protein FACS1894121_1310 [Bacteroidia bacterium]